MEQPSVEFKKCVKGRNFMTPNILGYYEINEGVCELSKGEGFEREPIFGVTIVKNGKQVHEESKMFYSQKEAINYIDELKK